MNPIGHKTHPDNALRSKNSAASETSTVPPAPMIERYGNIEVVRDDLYGTSPNIGGKVRGARLLFSNLAGTVNGAVAYGSEISNHVRISACTAREFSVPCLIVVPKIAQLRDSNITVAREAGSEVVETERSRISDLREEAQRIANERKWALIPWGMKCRETIDVFSGCVQQLPKIYDNIVVTCGTGATTAGIAEGLGAIGASTKLWAVCIGRHSRKVREGLRSITDLRYSHLSFVNLGNYGTRSSVQAPFPTDPYYDGRAWESLQTLKLQGSTLFWNLGSWEHS